jgi:dimethylhistidine N-methyltransferase
MKTQPEPEAERFTDRPAARAARPVTHDEELTDASPDAATFRTEVLAGLARPQKSLPCKYLYDERGSALFERICTLEEYYPTRTELAIMDAHVDAMASCLGPRCLLIEYGAGSGLKTRVLLAAMDRPAAYVPIDISYEALAAAREDLARRFPELEILPLCADYTADHELPEPALAPRRRTVYFPGSTIGNFEPDPAAAFLRHMRDEVGDGGGLLIGVDLHKDAATLERAYDDAEGVTAAFNLNLLRRLREELGAELDPAGFRHRARFVPEQGRVEMHLESRRPQTIRLAGRTFTLQAGETIHTENSYKHTPDGFAALAAAGGWRVSRVWTDPADLFSVQYLEAD